MDCRKYGDHRGAAPELGIGRQGIAAIVRGADQHVENIIIRNCYIHDIWGQLGGNTEFTGYNSCAIVVQMQNEKNDGCDDNGLNATLDNVLIENNHMSVVISVVLLSVDVKGT